MTIQLSAAVAALACDTVFGTIDGGATPGKLLIYDGAIPADVATAVTTQVKLIEFVLPDPAFGAATDQPAYAEAAINPVTDVVGLADGTATWFRLVDGNDEALMQGSVSAPAEGGDLELSSTSVVVGVDVMVISLFGRMPK